MKSSELKDKSVDELQAELETLLHDQFKLRMQHSTGQLGQTHLLTETRRNIARVKTQISSVAGN